jgi:hypothetical protein
MSIGMPPTYYEWAKMLVCEYAGERLFVYDSATGEPVAAGDTLVGNPVIGYGRDLARRGITSAEATVMLHGDLAAAERTAVALVGAGPAWSSLSAVRRGVLMALAHHAGPALDSAHGLPDALRCGHWQTVAHEIMDLAADQRTLSHYFRLALMMRDDAFHPA